MANELQTFLRELGEESLEYIYTIDNRYEKNRNDATGIVDEVLRMFSLHSYFDLEDEESLKRFLYEKLEPNDVARITRLFKLGNDGQTIRNHLKGGKFDFDGFSYKKEIEDHGKYYLLRKDLIRFIVKEIPFLGMFLYELDSLKNRLLSEEPPQ